MSAVRGVASRAGTAAGKTLGVIDAFLSSAKRARVTTPPIVGRDNWSRNASKAELEWLGLTDAGGLSGVSESRALAISTVWACLKVVSEDTARHEFSVVREAGPGLYQAISHPLNQVINWRANGEMSSYSFWECQVWNMLFRMDSFAEIENSRMRRVKALWPIPTDSVEVYRDELTNKLLYDCWEMGRSGKPALGMTRDAILHLHNLSSDGIVGMDWRRIHSRTTLKKPAAITDFVSTFFENYCKPLVSLIYPPTVSLSPEQKAEARAAFMARQSGKNMGTPAVLDRGVTIETHALDLSTSQVQEILDKSPAEICALFRVPPHKIGDLSRSTNNNIEAQDVAYSTECLGPMRARIEGELSMLVDGELVDGAPLRVVMDPWELTRGAMKDRAAAEEIWIRTGMMSVNQARGLEGWMPLSDKIANETTYDANRVPASLLHEVTSARAIKDGARDPAGATKTPSQGGTEGAAARAGAGGVVDADVVRGVVRGFAPMVSALFTNTLRVERDRLARARDKNGNYGSPGDFARRANEVVAGSGEAARNALEPVAGSVERVLGELVSRSGNKAANLKADMGGALSRMSELYRLSSQMHASEQMEKPWDDVRIAQEAQRRAEQVLDELAVRVTNVDE